MTNEAFEFELSVSKVGAISKEKAGVITEVTTKSVNLSDQMGLGTLFSTRLYGTNLWNDGKIRKHNYVGMTGICIDVDSDFTIDQARELFAPYRYILHTTTSHQTAKSGKPACDRFRVILPFDPKDGPQFKTLDEAEGVFRAVKNRFPFADVATLTPAGKFYPFLGDESKYVCEVNTAGEWFSIKPQTATPKPPTKHTRKTDTEYIRHDQTLTLAEGTTHSLETLRPLLHKVTDHKLPCYCPFCDDINSANASATIQVTADSFVQLYCAHCKSIGGQAVYIEDPIEPSMFMIEDHIVRVAKNQNNAYVVKVSDDYFKKDDVTPKKWTCS